MLLPGRCIVVSLHRVGERSVDHDGGTWYSILFRCPGAEVGHLAAFGAEGAPGVAFPGAGLVTEGADHGRYCITPYLRIGRRQPGKSVWQTAEGGLWQRRSFKSLDGDGLLFHLLD
jgi:hypothetical protein